MKKKSIIYTVSSQYGKIESESEFAPTEGDWFLVSWEKTIKDARAVAKKLKSSRIVKITSEEIH